MFKKSAFTLAEILIALTIIGVVAALTVPRVMSNTNAKTNIVKLKKSYATISNALKIGATRLNYDLSDVTAYSGDTPYTIQDFLTKTMDVKLVSSDGSYPFAGSPYKISDGEVLGENYGTSGITENATIFKLRDGSYLIFPKKADNSKTISTDGCSKKSPCIAYIDINGPKEPNELIGCTNGVSSLWAQDTTPDACTVDDSAITDLYTFVVYGTTITPADSACETIVSYD